MVKRDDHVDDFEKALPVLESDFGEFKGSGECLELGNLLADTCQLFYLFA